MRITKITVKNLFGMFNHAINLNLDNRITIIHGKNGVGKTALLRIIDGLFNLKYYEIYNIPFEEFSVYFDNHSYLQVNKTDRKNNKNSKEVKGIIFHYKLENSREETFEVKAIDTDNIDFPISIIDDLIPELERIAPRQWLNRVTQDILSLEDVLLHFGNQFPREYQFKNQPRWLKELRHSIYIRFIESQRLLNLSYARESRMREKRPSMMLSVATYADDLAKEIKAKLAEYGSLSQSLDRNFPVRVMQQKAGINLTDEELRQKLYQLENKRHQLISAGLLDKDENNNFQVQEQIDDS